MPTMTVGLPPDGGASGTDASLELDKACLGGVFGNELDAMTGASMIARSLCAGS